MKSTVVVLIALFMFSSACYGVNTGLDLTDNVGKVSVINSENLNLGSEFTLEAWIWLDSYGLSQYEYRQQLICKWTAPNMGSQRSFLLGLWEDQLELAICTTGNFGDVYDVYSQQSVPLHQWIHVAGTLHNNEMTLYINGVKDNAVAPVPSGPYASVAPTFIGGTYGAGGQAFDGRIDEVRMSDVARYTESFTLPGTEFQSDEYTMLLMHLNEGNGSTTENLGYFNGDGLLVNGAKWGEGAPIPEPSLAVLLVGLMALRGRKA